MTFCRRKAKSSICISGNLAFEQMKQKGVLYFETEGKNKGCWVMKRASGRNPLSSKPQPKAMMLLKRKTARTKTPK